MRSKAQAASPLLRRISVALKTYGLYPPPSPVADRAVAELLDGLHRCIEAYGPIDVRVSKHSLQVDAATFMDIAAANLAYHLYTRKVIGLTIAVGVTARDLSIFLTTVRKDRASLEAEGGVAHLLRQAGIHTIRIAEIAIALAQTPQDPSWEALQDLLAHGRFSLEHREIVAETLHGGPKAIAAMFEHVHAILGDAAGRATTESQSENVYRLIKGLDRFVLNEPVEDHQQLYTDIAAAVLLLEEPVRTPLEQTLAAQASGDETARLLLSRLSEQRLAGIVPLSSLQNDAPREASPRGEPDEDERREFLDPELQLLMRQQATREASQAPAFAALDAVAGRPTELAFKESAAMNDDLVTCEAIATLVDVYRSLDDESDIADIAHALAESLPWLVQHREFRLLRAALQGLDEAASRMIAHHRALAGILSGLHQGRPLADLLEALWNAPDTETGDDVRVCVELLADKAVSSFVRIFGDEPRAGVRRLVCDILVSSGRDHVDEIGAFVADPRWYVVRNVANILGRLGDPKGVVHLALLAEYPEYRVRREAVEALVRIGTDQAEAQIVTFLDDPDERIRLKAVLSLNDTGVHQALSRLLSLLERHDPWNRQFLTKQAIVAAVVRVRARDALPVLERLARRRFGIRPSSRTLRRQAREALVTIAEGGPVGERSLITLTMGTNRP
ncbi:MAG: HEAT repeat domain-containing protein [Armatimonadota bacterium]